MAKVTIVLTDNGAAFCDDESFHIHTEWEPPKQAGQIPTAAQEIGMKIQAALMALPQARTK